MFGKSLRGLWERINPPAPEPKLYIVYAVKNGFEAFVPSEDVEDRVIHNTIAKHENTHPKGRYYVGTVQPGSFNFCRVQAVNGVEALNAAKTQGLQYESLPVVLARYINNPPKCTQSAVKKLTSDELSGLREAIAEATKILRDGPR